MASLAVTRYITSRRERECTLIAAEDVKHKSSEVLVVATVDGITAKAIVPVTIQDSLSTNSIATILTATLGAFADLHVVAEIENWFASVKLMGLARPSKLVVITTDYIVHCCCVRITTILQQLS